MPESKDNENNDNNNYQLWAAEENWLREYLAANNNFQFNESYQDLLKAYSELETENIDAPDILSLAGDTASINIFGVLRKINKRVSFIDFLLGRQYVSYLDIIKATKIIEANQIIKNVNILFDTPGGNINGLDETWMNLMSLRKNKTVTAINTGQLASAGYYLASAAHEIHSSSETNEVGSIGILAVGIDTSKREEREGIKKIMIVSSNAPEKLEDITTKKGQKSILDRINTHESFFFQRISVGRDLDVDYIKKNFGRGGMLISQAPEKGINDALSVGMIDKVLNPISIKGKDKFKKRKKSASISQNFQQEKKMTLAELLAANPEAKTELDRQLQAKYDSGLAEGEKKGEKKGLEKSTKIAEQVFTYLKADSPYATHVGVQNVAIDVLKGEQPLSNLKLAISMFDEKGEKQKSDDAKDETKKHGETPPNHDPQSTDGKITDETALNTEVDKLKGLVFPGLKPKSNVA